MQFEEFDKKIKEAAEHHHPAYDEQAWGKMNKLLDKHMPQKEERRRRFILLFFLLFLLLGAGIFYTVQSLVTKEPAQVALGNTTNRAGAEEKKSNGGINDKAETAVRDEVKDKDKDETGIKSSTTQPAGSSDPAISSQSSLVNKTNTAAPANTGTVHKKQTDKSNTSTALINKPADIVINPVYQAGAGKKKKKPAAVPALTSETPVTAGISAVNESGVKNVSANPDNSNQVTVPVSTLPGNEKKSQVTDAISQAVNKKEENNVLAVVQSPVTDSAKNKKSAGPKKKSQLILTFSAGPDASFTPAGNPGPVIAVTGAGIGYIYRERLSIRAGFYNAKKIYTASPADYNPPANFYNYYPFLTKVDANCRVYEIPVSLGYHFGASKNHSWFASASLSSYLMKRETYNYSYKTTAWGTVQQRKFTFNNKNEHFFSVLGISAGYQRKITNRISFIAEPYFRMPMSGVGYGKVKLNSAGVLFSLAVQPAAFIPHKQKK